MGGVRGDVIALAFIYTTIMEMGQPPAVQSDELFHIQCFHGNIIYMEVKLRNWHFEGRHHSEGIH